MGYEVDYTTIRDEFDRREQAIKDLKHWLGIKRYKDISRTALQEKAKGYQRHDIAVTMEMFAGINGYPIQVWLDYLGFYPQTPNTSQIVADAQAQTPNKG